MIKYIYDLPDIDSFFELYESTGWNDKDKKSKEEKGYDYRREEIKL